MFKLISSKINRSALLTFILLLANFSFLDLTIFASENITLPDNYVISSAIYDDVRMFSENLAAVKVNDKWGFINKKFEIVIQPQFEDVQEFTDGLAGVKVNNKWGFIDKSGKMIIEAQYNNVQLFSEGLAGIKINELWGFIDKSGAMIVKPQYIYVYDFEDGLAFVFNDKPAIIDKTGKYIVQPVYNDIYHFYDGMAAVFNEYPSGNTIAYIDKTGKEVIKPTKTWITLVGCNDAYNVEFHEGMAISLKDDKYGFINKQGEFVIQPEFDWLCQFSDGLAAAKKGDKYGYIDKTGKFAIPPKFNYRLCGWDCSYTFHDGLASFKSTTDENSINDIGFINKKGEVVIEPQYDLIPAGHAPFPSFENGLALVTKAVKTTNKNTGETNITTWKCGVINTKGEFIILPIYDFIGMDSRNFGLISVQINNKYGFVDYTGKTVLKPQLNNAMTIAEDCQGIQFSDSNKWAFICKLK